GKGVLFTVTKISPGNSEQFAIALLDLAVKTRSVLIPEGSHARCLPTGHIICGGTASTARAVGFDLKRRALVGTPVPVLEAVSSSQGGMFELSVSSDGTLVYLTGGALSITRTLLWVDRKGRETPLGTPARSYLHPRLSPDGSRVAFFIGDRDQERDIWIWDLA